MKMSKIYNILGNKGLAVVAVVTALLSVSCHSSKKSIVNSFKPQDIPFSVKSLKCADHQKKIAEEAISWIGTPYAYAKCDKKEGTDCSGMVLRVYEDVLGWKLPRNSAKQAEFCVPVAKEDVETGDLVFFATGHDPEKISHVGIMVDDVSFVHASTKKGVVLSRIDTPYYIRTFKGFGRVKRGMKQMNRK